MAVLCKCTCASSHPAVIGACSSYARATEDGGLAICEGCRRALAAAQVEAPATVALARAANDS